MKIIALIMILMTQSAFALSLKVGDILLQPLQCWSCSLIEAQTKSEYSHIGVVIEKKGKSVWVAEAFHKVRKVTLAEFHKKTQKKSAIKVMRPHYVAPDLFDLYQRHFEGLNYDSQFRWYNSDDLGEKIYCSELLYKLFRLAGMHFPKVKPMKFDVNREYWDRFFQGDIPDGELGISPEDFNRERKYSLIGFIE